MVAFFFSKCAPFAPVAVGNQHPPYLPDLEPCDLFWCTTLKQDVLYAIQKE
jgi:hypothetical protein